MLPTDTGTRVNSLEVCASNQSYSIGSLINTIRSKLGLETISLPKSLPEFRKIYFNKTSAYFDYCSIRKAYSSFNEKRRNSNQQKAESELQKLKQYSSFLPKTVFESQPEVVLFIGLEGTGHHLVRKQFSKLFANNYSEPFLFYANMISCNPYSYVFGQQQNLEKLKKRLLSFESQVLFINTVSGT